MQNNNYNILIGKLDEFIRKYYKNQLIKGSLYTFTALTGAWLVFTGMEYLGHFNTTIRAILFWSFIAAAIFSLWKFLIVPILGLIKAGKRISHEHAANIIGTHFTNVQDKLLNTLQLHKEAENSKIPNELLLAGINQKINELKPIPFSSAIDFKSNNKYIKYAAVPLSVIILILFAAPSILFDTSERLVKHNTHFEKPAPFKFEVLNKNLSVIEGEDLTLEVNVNGEVIPNDVYIDIDGNQFKLDKDNRISFNYKFRNIRKNSKFHLLADGYTSAEYEIEAIPNPSILNFNVSLTYPPYTQKQPERLSNTGDLSIPAGTKVNWEFNSRNSDNLELVFNDTTLLLKPEKNVFSLSRSFKKSTSYTVKPSNEYLVSKEPMGYNVNVIPDLYPVIQTEQQPDSLSSQLIYFKGIIRDDYGFSKLAFHYRFIKTSQENLRNKQLNTTLLAVNKNVTQDQFFHSWDMKPLFIEPGEEIEYYFEVWDNDGINGSKSSRSQSMIYRAPSLKELSDQADKNADKMKSELEKSIEQSKKLQKDLKSVTRDLLEKKNLTYDDKKKIEDLLNQQRELENQIENLKQQNQQNNIRESEYRRSNEQIMEKKSQLEDLFEKLMSEEMKQMLRELEKMMAELNKDQLKKMVDEMQLDNKDLEKQLDRTLELFKQLEVEQKLQQAIDKLDQLSKEQKDLAEKTENKNESPEELQEKQKELNKDFEDLKSDIDDLEKKNEELEFPQELGDNEQELSEISEDMKQSEEQLGGDKKEQKKAAGSQKSAAEKMDDLSQKMKQQQQQAQSEQAEEDMQSLRILLENLISFSIDQESLMEDLKNIDVNNPQFTKLAQKQRELKDDAAVLEDSLFALSKRVVQISSVVNTEIAAINYNIEKSIANLQDRFVPQARSEQQYVMTSVNNLALILTDAFEQMQQQQKESQQQMQGDGNCKKPGSGKPSPSAEKMRQMQQKLNEQMKALKKKMDGEQKGEGKKGKRGEGGMSEELARMAAQQEALRNELQKLSNQENKDGQGTLGNLERLAKRMEETEKDLVNRKITQETIARQEEILTRLLESEKAEREREQDEKRQSNEGKDNLYQNTSQFEEYKKLKMKEVELLKTIPPGLNAFYKNLVNYYFQALEN